jgi:hypothetical protein
MRIIEIYKHINYHWSETEMIQIKSVQKELLTWFVLVEIESDLLNRRQVMYEKPILYMAFKHY